MAKIGSTLDLLILVEKSKRLKFKFEESRIKSLYNSRSSSSTTEISLLSYERLWASESKALLESISIF